MYSKIMSKMILFILFLFIFAAGNLHSQYENYDKVEVARSQYICARTMTDNMAEKLRLNNNQKKALVDILIDYQDNLENINNNSSENSELIGGRTKSKANQLREMDRSVNKQIVNILDRRQLTIYNRIKPEWWKHFKDIVFQRKK